MTSVGNMLRRSRPARGAWIEIDCHNQGRNSARGRAPHGARGLKYHCRIYDNNTFVSRPARGAWIEITRSASPRWRRSCRAPHGARGLKYYYKVDEDGKQSRAPHGARGLKYGGAHACHGLRGRAPHGARGLKSSANCHPEEPLLSRPARGAWIEISG